MCTTCGCQSGEIHNDNDEHEHVGPDGLVYRHTHHSPHGHARDHEQHRKHAHESTRLVQIERDILAKNNAFAAANRQRFEQDGVLALNLVSSPGSGKTALLVRTIAALHDKTPLAVIEGDQQTSLDAERIRSAGAQAVQINTGKSCHLDAQRVQEALGELNPLPESIMFIENVGNLVCPAAFDLGEAAKVVILSVTEGEDKPLKYPDMFRAARLMLLNKCDLLPHLQFDVQQVLGNARRVNPAIEVLQISATTGEGMAAWLDWLRRELTAVLAKRNESIAALKRRVAELEAQLETQLRAQQTAAE
ncbi:hydrogenase nickel incorporation protein HypB [Propionivibrio limicola]|uniref:hydrogenase nickel incorporation protein HypB n=1 Tax=Propionivibrio limicola TaxID=167645 RepID=UPI001290B88A|nr:hydrogenase nickel incorporation protein HypB [Propionivibrio limicola]